MSSISFITHSVSGPIAPTPCIAIGREAGGMQDFEPCMLLEQIASALRNLANRWLRGTLLVGRCHLARRPMPGDLRYPLRIALTSQSNCGVWPRGCLTKVADSKIGLATAAVCT